jgi:hypothetical protein
VLLALLEPTIPVKEAWFARLVRPEHIKLELVRQHAIFALLAPTAQALVQSHALYVRLERTLPMLMRLLASLHRKEATLIPVHLCQRCALRAPLRI